MTKHKKKTELNTIQEEVGPYEHEGMLDSYQSSLHNSHVKHKPDHLDYQDQAKMKLSISEGEFGKLWYSKPISS